MKRTLGKTVHFIKAKSVSKSGLVFPRCGSTAMLMSEVGSLFLALSNGAPVCDAKNELGEWDSLPAALPLAETVMRKKLLLPN